MNTRTAETNKVELEVSAECSQSIPFLKRTLRVKGLQGNVVEIPYQEIFGIFLVGLGVLLIAAQSFGWIHPPVH